MSNLIPFDYSGQTVRTIDLDGEPWFVAADVSAVLELGNPRSSLALLDDDEKGVHAVDTPGGVQRVTVINEPGLYSLIFRSRKAEAKAFKRWVTHEVLPSIRKTGGYISPTATADQLAVIIDRATRQAEGLRSLIGIVDPRWLESKGRHLGARMLGEEPEEDHSARPITVGEYLEDRGVTATAARKLAPTFGKRLKARYLALHGETPGTSRRFVDGAHRDVAVYTEADRGLFDAVWADLTEDAAA